MQSLGSNISAQPTRWRRVHAYLRLPHAVPLLAVMLATLALAGIVASGFPPAYPTLPLLLAMLGGQLAVGVTNELADLSRDREVRPNKPLVSGDVTIRGAWTVLLFGLALMVGAGAFLGPVGFGLCALGNGLGIAYSLWFKQTAWGALPYFLAVPLLPIWIMQLFDRFSVGLLLIYLIGGPAVVAVHLAQSLPDIDTDRSSGVTNLTALLGVSRSLGLMWFGLIVSLLLATTVLAREGQRTVPAFAFCAGAGMLIVGHIALGRHDRLRAVQVAFPVAAAVTGLLGCGWVLAVTT